MRTRRKQEVVDWTIDLPPGWFMMPLEQLSTPEQSQWIEEVIAQVQEAAVEPGSPTALRSELAQLRTELLRQQNPWLNAAVSIRPEKVMTVGCLLLTSIIELEEGEGPDSFAAGVEEAFAHPARGTRTHSSRVWREHIDAGELVGSFQRFEIVDYGEGIGTVEDRTVFGVFPENCIEFIRFEFRTWDLAAHADFIDETSVIARSARVALANVS